VTQLQSLLVHHNVNFVFGKIALKTSRTVLVSQMLGAHSHLGQQCFEGCHSSFSSSCRPLVAEKYLKIDTRFGPIENFEYSRSN